MIYHHIKQQRILKIISSFHPFINYQKINALGLKINKVIIIQVSKMNPQTLKYLQKDEVGKVIATGLAMLYMNKPDKPIKYLGEWLKTYSHNEKQMAKLAKHEKNKQETVKIFDLQAKDKEAMEKQKHDDLQKDKKVKDEFRQLIKNHQYQQELLQQALPEFIEKNAHATGVYIGQLNHPPRQITDEDTDQLAHLNTGAEKVINYIGSSVSHKQMMRGKILNANQGITASAFALLEQSSAPVLGQDGQQVPQPPKKKYIYIPNVVKNQKIHYYKIPKLGSYLAVPIVCNQYLTESNFDASLNHKLEYLKQVEDLEKTKKQQLDQLLKDKEDLEKKISQMVEKNVDEAQIELIKVELKQIQDVVKQKQAQKIDETDPELAPNKRNYIVCADTLGKDKQFSEQTILFVTQLTEHFKNSWQNKQKQLLKKDIETQVQYLKSLTSPPETIKHELFKSIQLNEEEQKQVHAITDQHLKSFKSEQIELNKLRASVESNAIYLQAFLQLKKLRVIKYKDLIQSMLFFIGHTKSEVNAPKRASLNWKVVKNKFVNKDTFQKIFGYNPIGPKNKQFTLYSKTPYLINTFDKIDEQEVFKYNIALGAIAQFIRRALQLRTLDVQIRKTKFETEKAHYQKVVQQNQTIRKNMEDAQTAAQAQQNFNLQEWTANYTTQHPLHELPAKPEQEIDNDM